LGCVLAVAWAATAYAGVGEGFFYAKGPKRIPDGHRAAKLRMQSILPTDIDPTIDYVSVSLRVNHPQTRDLIVRLKRPNFIYMGGPQSSIPRGITLSHRDTQGKNLGRRKCFDSNPGFAPRRFTTLNDSGGPPPPMGPSTPPPPLSDGSAPYAGVFQPTEPLSGFSGYHAAPSTDPASPETWTLIVKDVRTGHTGGHPRRKAKLLCAVLYLHRF
jgi:hypothetical protein